jgi:hypothetical protein
MFDLYKTNDDRSIDEGRGLMDAFVALKTQYQGGEFMSRLMGRLTLALLALLITFAGSSMRPALAALPTCAVLMTDHDIVHAPGIKSVSSAVVPADSHGNAAYCGVHLLYGTNATENINIVIALPLSAADGGSGRMQGAWNGRTQGLGGGGCTGISAFSTSQLGPVNTGYVISGTDLGHSGGDCTPGVNADGTYNFQFIEDFIRIAIKQQILFSQFVAAEYYGLKPAYNYWNGCSTGGRQGYLLAQELGDQLDGILAAAPAMYWTRFQTAQMWGQIVMKEMIGGPLNILKAAQVQASAIAACDANDGVVDGVIDDPRSCTFNAEANICGAPNAPAANCLTAAEAAAVNKVWDGPRNAKGEKIWFGLDPGSDFAILDGANPFALGVIQFQWDEHDLNFSWTNVPSTGYPQVAQDGSRNIADVTDTFGPLDQFKAHGGKLLTWVGANDQFIYPRGVINYYRQMASRYSHTGDPDFANLQKFFRLFRAPSVGHCGIALPFPLSGNGDGGPVPVDPFGALVNWVEHGVAPETLLAAGGNVPTRQRPLCPYPQTAIYNGSGDPNAAASWHCGGNLETPQIVCKDILARYKHEEHGSLDFRGSGLEPRDCHVPDRHEDDDD